MDEMKNIDIYNLKMSKSLYDKVFFLSKVNSETFVDFGCADGYMIAWLAREFPDTDFIGYDVSEEMIKLAKSKYGSLHNVKFYSDWKDVQIAIKDCRNVSLILSSVIHEVYSYSSPAGIKTFWDQVFKSGFKHVIIRDMTISEKNTKQIIDLESISQVRRTAYIKHLSDFESRWGDISLGINWLHFLLKYRYVENWDREVRENYLPLTTEKLLEQIPRSYIITYMSDYTLSYIKETVRKDFDVDVKFPTHIKLILTSK